MYCRTTTSLLYARMIVVVQACTRVDELATESESEFGSVQCRDLKTGPGKLTEL